MARSRKLNCHGLSWIDTRKWSAIGVGQRNNTIIKRSGAFDYINALYLMYRHDFPCYVYTRADILSHQDAILYKTL